MRDAQSTTGTEVPVSTYDVIALRAELRWLDELEHPWGPFPTYQRHLDYILSQYGAVSAQISIANNLLPDTRKD
jgi:hypothetical protein